MITNHPSKTLILGGARSGKSRYAEELAVASDKALVYIATATVFDDEMQQRVKQHKKDRQAHHWKTVEEPLAVAKAIQRHDNTDTIILVDCLTLWLNNLFAEQDQTRLATELSALLECLDTTQGSLIFVSNEVGQGIVPLGELSRQFVDESGRLHQQLAQQVDRVVLMVAGLPLVVKE